MNLSIRSLTSALRRRPAPAEPTAPARDADELALLQSAVSGYLLGASFERTSNEERQPALVVRLPGLPAWTLTPAPDISALAGGAAERPPKRRLSRVA